MPPEQKTLLALEHEMDQATNRLREAKLALKQAKALVKVARKTRKKLRKEHGRLLDELGAAETPMPASGPKSKQSGIVKIAASPEPKRIRRKTSAPAAIPADAIKTETGTAPPSPADKGTQD